MPTPHAIRILLIEDEPIDAEIVRRHLLGVRSPRYRIDWVQSLQPGLDRLGKGDSDVVLLDLHLPDADGLDALLQLREADPEVPVVVFTVAPDMEDALRSLRMGAQDYLVKDELAGPVPLQRSIRYAIERRRIESEKRLAEERLAQAEKLAGVGVLSAGLAVGFNQLLGQVLDHADAAIHELRNTAERPEPLRRRLNEIRRSALRAAEMTNQLRDHAAARPLRARPVELSEFVRDMAELIDSLAPGGVEMAYQLCPRAVAAKASRLHLHQILLALVHNAVEAIDGEGAVCVSTERVRVDAEALLDCDGSAAAQPGAYVALRVGDDGCGLNEPTRPRIFEPFFSTKAAGRGLGLSVVLGIARQYGALIHVESPPEGGSRFSVLFPSADAA